MMISQFCLVCVIFPLDLSGKSFIIGLILMGSKNVCLLQFDNELSLSLTKCLNQIKICRLCLILPFFFFFLIEYSKAAKTYLKRDDWYMWANMKKGGITLPMFTSLDAYWPGIQVGFIYLGQL